MPRSAAPYLVCALLAASMQAAQVAAAPEEFEALAQRALDLELDRASQWLALGHYEKRFHRLSYESAVQTPGFFLSGRGAVDPRAELLATLAALLDPAAHAPGGGAMTCAFPGRLFGRIIRFVAGDVATDASLGFDQRFTLSRRAALRADFAAHRYAGEAWIDAQIAVQWTF